MSVSTKEARAKDSRSEAGRVKPSWHGADPDAPDFRSTLHERYRRLREVAPVSLTPRGEWRLARYQDIDRLLRRTKTGVRTTDGRLRFDDGEFERLFMIDVDGADHRRLRKLVARYFTPRAIGALRERVIEISNTLLDEMGTGEVDFVSGLARPLPIGVICEMLGVPVEDGDMLAEWTGEVTYLLLGTEATDEQRRRAASGFESMRTYVGGLVDRRRGESGEDLISVLISANEEGDRLTDTELLWQVLGLILAGFETTIALIAHAIRLLLLNPGELEALRRDRSLVGGAIEEVLRYEPPAAGVSRFLHEEAEFGGYRLPVDSLVSCALASANRDPEIFDEPDRFDIRRTPNRHLAFGMGPHVCLGLQLARMEGAVTLETVLDRYSTMELVTEQLEWERSLARVPAELRVRVS